MLENLKIVLDIGIIIADTIIIMLILKHWKKGGD